jgi:transcriptional regulator with XRE-family HTH domain
VELHNTILKLCREKGITPTKLARVSGIKQPTLHGWITGRKVKNLEDLLKICEVFNVSLYFLLFDKPDPYEKTDEGKILEELFKGEIRIVIQRAK